LNGLPGAEGTFLEMFKNAIGRNDLMSAASIVADSSGDKLRNQNTLDKFKSFPQ